MFESGQADMREGEALAESRWSGLIPVHQRSAEVSLSRNVDFEFLSSTPRYSRVNAIPFEQPVQLATMNPQRAGSTGFVPLFFLQH